jgi:YD repeat-containing protein
MKLMKPRHKPNWEITKTATVYERAVLHKPPTSTHTEHLTDTQINNALAAVDSPNKTVTINYDEQRQISTIEIRDTQGGSTTYRRLP